MKIELTICEENPRFLFLMVNDELWKRVYAPFFSKHLSQLRSCTTQAELEERFALIEEKLAWQESLRLLALKSRLSSEMRKKLLLKGLSSSSIQKAIDRCVEAGYLDDFEEIRKLAQREMRKGYGPRWVMAKLRTKGEVPDHFIEELRKEQNTALQRLLQKRPSLRSMDKKKLLRLLSRRGFDINCSSEL